MRQIKIFDTTLRDGEQSPGCSMNLREKLQVAQCLERLKVDVIEAGFAIASPGDFESVQAISRQVKDLSLIHIYRAEGFLHSSVISCFSSRSWGDSRSRG